MKTIVCSVVLLFLIAACSARTAPQGSSSDSPGEPRLSINAAPRQGFAPMRVTFRGNLADVDEHDQEYYCLQEEWDFGDGAKSTEKPNCDPYSPDAKIKTEFFTDHVYEKHGNYTVRLILGDGKVRSRQISVVIIERDIGVD